LSDERERRELSELRDGRDERERRELSELRDGRDWRDGSETLPALPYIFQVRLEGFIV